MQVTNQTPIVLSPVYDASIKGDFDPATIVQQTMADPIYAQPKVAGSPVSITSNGQDVTATDIRDFVLSCCGETLDPACEAAVKTIYGKTLLYFDAQNPLTVQDVFAVQAAVQEKLPYPDDKTVYTPATDVIPSSREFLAGKCTFERWFASLDFYARPHTLGFYFANEKAFDAFKAWLAAEVAIIAPGLPATTNQLFSEFDKLELKGLTESLLLRKNDGDNNEEFSFPRTLIAYMMRYTQQASPAEYGVMPFRTDELFCPNSVVMVNVERHAQASAKAVADEWNTINTSLDLKVRIVSNNKLSKLTGAVRAMKKVKSNAAFAVANNGLPIERAARAKFRKTAPTSVDLTRLIKRVIAKMSFVNKSENTFKSTKMTFARPNRRDPDDFNKQGKMVSTHYKPDIHLYIDTSGSISERNYQDAIKACIAMARKLNVNLYFNSFSHVMSQCTHLHTRDKSAKQVYAEFQKVPKVTGGTDYAQIWRYIDENPKRRRELSIIITDFEYHAPNRFVKHPRNLYYIPCSNMDWDYMVHCAEGFVKSMRHIDPNCRKHLLF